MSFYRIYRPQVIDEIDNLSVRGVSAPTPGKAEEGFASRISVQWPERCRENDSSPPHCQTI